MSVTITREARIGPASWLLEWSSTESDPTYYIYLDGQLQATTTREWWQFDLLENEQVQIEILDSAATPQTAYPSRATIAWLPVDDAERYKVDQYSGGAWSTVRTTYDDIASGYTHTTTPLADDTTHQFRVVPVGENEIDGNEINVNIHMVRRPDKPDVAYTYNDGTATVTIASA